MEKEDLRSTRTQRALDDAMLSLLNHQKFSKITVRDLCDEAAISRASFYSRFDDKYDFLNYWLPTLIPEMSDTWDDYETAEQVINDFIYEKRVIFKNLIYDANDETMEHLFNAMLLVLNMQEEKNSSGKISPQDVVYSNMYAGGLIYYFLWLVKHNFPQDIKPMNTYLYELTMNFKKWRACACEDCGT